jgi:alpha-tubulin suppressor-like RCC1 family protein
MKTNQSLINDDVSPSVYVFGQNSYGELGLGKLPT